MFNCNNETNGQTFLQDTPEARSDDVELVEETVTNYSCSWLSENSNTQLAQVHKYNQLFNNSI